MILKIPEQVKCYGKQTDGACTPCTKKRQGTECHYGFKLRPGPKPRFQTVATSSREKSRAAVDEPGPMLATSRSTRRSATLVVTDEEERLWDAEQKRESGERIRAIAEADVLRKEKLKSRALIVGHR